MEELDNYIAGKLEGKRYNYDGTKYEAADNFINDVIKELKAFDRQAKRDNKKSEAKIKNLR